MAADLLLGLGAAVVKVACKVWLKDSTFASDASAEVIDVVKEKLTGELEQRHARRLFEDLEVPVAKKLEGLREHEFRWMPENEWNAGILAVGDTLRRAQFSDADIFEGDLDPLYLRRQVVRASPVATRDLSEAGAALYARLLTECCAYVVELTSTLPRFNAGAFGEILRRQTMILQQVTEILERMPSSDTLKPDEGQAETDFAAVYRRQVVSQLDRLELFGVTVSDSVRGYPLSTAYIPLTVSGGHLHDKIRFDWFAANARAIADGSVGAETEPSSLKIDRVLSSTTKLFLRGEAGSGKTTLLQWVAVRSARQDFPDHMSEWNDSVPFLIRLRRSVGKELPVPEDFVTEVGRHIAGDMPQGWVHRLLREGKALILVDGLDELPEAQRRSTREWIASLINAFPDARYIVTSRPGAASSTWLDRQGFDSAEVEPMGWPDVQEFVSHWHAAFRAEFVDQDHLEQISASEAALLDSLYARRHLRTLATSPLLCALLCALNLDRRAQLPGDRMELYAIALEMLLERRDLERSIPANETQLSRTQKTLLLEDLAYWLIRNGWSDAPKERAAERIGRRLADMPGITTDDGATALDALILRSGLIREPVADRIDFVHRTFEECLAARAAVNDDQCGELIRNAHDDQWREVIVMAAGHAQRRQREELLSGILDRAEDETKHRQILQTLAVACLETSPQLSPALHARIQSVAESQLPPRVVRQAEILARVGEPLLDLLADRPLRGRRQAAATIRAASMVGGPAALPIIARCAKTAGQSVNNELMRAWPLFGAKEYAERVLSGSPHAGAIILDDAAQIPGLSRIREMRILLIEGSAADGNLDFIRESPQLEELNIIGGSEALDLAALCDHPSLYRLILQGNGPRVNINPLSSIPGLREFLFYVDRVESAEAIRECAKLEKIGLIDLKDLALVGRYLPDRPVRELMLLSPAMENLQQLPKISQIDQLQSLDLNTCRELRSFSGIDQWAGTLRRITARWCRNVEDIAALASLPELEYLDLSYSQVNDLSVVRNIPRLSELVLLSEFGIVNLSKLEGIKSLTIKVRRNSRVHDAGRLGEGSKVVRV